ncbi:type VI secretion system baseplate subunit TssK [Pseudorhodoferax sp.]|uniref:type VI secretion system baseplate subunit TssK n=1 Tax=Pseudorhodoferax sp. TaxID=1993553 RepID=UPI002DD6AA2F|nr:type VI secretion system baseplate subunit TssK [Pseudorhodoferax sp.]
MTWQNKVLWTEGMFLQPQHFQQQDRASTRQLHARLSAAVGHGAGFSTLQIDRAALEQGQFAIASASGVLADGTAFDIPGTDAAPPALKIPSDVRDELVFLAVALSRPGVAESDVEGGGESMPPRFLSADVEVADAEAVSLRQAPILVGRLNLRLVLARDINDGYSTLGVARVQELTAGGPVALDDGYIAPVLHAQAHPVLDGYLRELMGLLHQRGDTLASLLAQPGRAGVGEIVDFLFLQTINRHEPLFNHVRRLPVLHPERLYAMCLQLAGELASYREGRRPPGYPDYLHDDLASCFKPVMADLRLSLSAVIERRAIPIELQMRKYGVRVAIISDVELQRNASFVLAASAQMPTEAVRARLPALAKIGPAEQIRAIVVDQVYGIALRPMAVAPPGIPYHAGFSYFELETRGSELWKQLETSGGLAVHIAGDFPGLELELWAVR